MKILTSCLVVLIVAIFILVRSCVSPALFFEPKENAPGMRLVYVRDIFHSRDGRAVANAIVRKNYGSLNELLSKKELVNEVGKYGITPLWVAVRRADEPAVRMILDKGGDPNAKTVWVKPLIVSAVMFGTEPILRMLLAHGGDPNTEYDGRPCLFYSTEASGRILVEAGADINRRGIEGQTAVIFLVSANRNIDFIIYLLEQGADPSLRDDSGHTLVDKMDYWIDRNPNFSNPIFQPVFQWLEEHGYSPDDLRTPGWKDEFEKTETARWQRESERSKKREADQIKAAEEWERE
jgi:hypothetical protein